MVTKPGFNIKAVDNEDGSLYGMVRMIGKKRTSKVYGICVVFETDEQKENLHLDKESLFFYGNTIDLEKNYRRERPFSDSELKSFSDKLYSEKTDLGDISGDSQIGFVLIPLEEMQLDPNRRSLVDKLVSKAEESLPNMINQLRKVEIRDYDPNFMKSFRNMFSSFPVDLRERALQNGSFYSIPRRKR